MLSPFTWSLTRAHGVFPRVQQHFVCPGLFFNNVVSKASPECLPTLLLNISLLQFRDFCIRNTISEVFSSLVLPHTRSVSFFPCSSKPPAASEAGVHGAAAEASNRSLTAGEGTGSSLSLLYPTVERNTSLFSKAETWGEKGNQVQQKREKVSSLVERLRMN